MHGSWPGEVKGNIAKTSRAVEMAPLLTLYKTVYMFILVISNDRRAGARFGSTSCVYLVKGRLR